MSKGRTAKNRGKGRGQTASKTRALREQQRPRLEFPEDLPVSAMLTEIQAAIQDNPVVIVAGATGSGKTTQIPKICLSLDRGLDGMIGLTQPRRLAAHSVARRLAEETGLAQGQGVGVQIRFDDQTAASTRVKVMTDGILLNELARDRQLRAYDTIIIDEAHERSLNIDFVLACLKKISKKRPELRVVVTSATINTDAFSAYFDNAPIIEVSGRAYPVSIEYQELATDLDLGKGVVDACFALRKQPVQGDTLVFLPGEREIRDVQRVLEKAIARNQGPGRAWEVIPVYGRLSDKDQRAIFTPGKKPRVVLATNIAETSITVPRIASVIDSGIARLSRYSAHSRIQRLSTEPISQASAAQRAGRCGRLGPGVCIRLFSENDFNQRPAFTDPEILRTNLASVVLTMQANRLGNIESFEFIDQPERKFIADAKRLLRELGALQADDTITTLGRKMARLPLDPRLARVLLAAPKTRALSECLVVVAALSVADPRVRPLEQAKQADAAHAKFADKRSDLAAFLNLWAAFGRTEKASSRRELQDWMAEHFLAPRRMYDWRAVHRQLKGQLAGLGLRDAATPTASLAALAKAFLTGFSTQVARLESDQTYLSCQSSSMNLHPSSALNDRPPAWIVPISLVRTRQLYARNCLQVDPAWVIKAVPELLHYSYDQARWDVARELVYARETVSLGTLVLRADREVALAEHDPQQSRRLFILHALVRGETQRDYPFRTSNSTQVELIAQAEGRERRALSITEREYVGLYEQVLPDSVIDGASLDAWHKAANESDLQPLSFTESQLSTAMAKRADASQTPASIKVAGLDAPLIYRFAPGEEGDGVTALVPETLREYLRPRDLDNAVPGLLQERIRLHVKALPKSYRQRLQPMNRTLEHLQQDLLDDDQDLGFRERLAACLLRRFGIPPTVCQWEALQEPLHLKVQVEFEQSTVSTQVERVAEIQVPETKWAFERVDPSQAIRQRDSGLERFAALSRSGDGVVLQTYARAARAEREHATAVAWLAARSAKQQQKMLRKDFRKLGKELIGFYDLAWRDELEGDFIACALDAAYPASSAQKVSTGEALDGFSRAGRSVLVESGQTLLSLLVKISNDYRQAVSRVTAATSAWPGVAADIDAQISKLVYAGFMQSASLERLLQFPRYLRAIVIRIERLPKSGQADAQAMAVVQRFERRLTELPAMMHDSREREQFRWLLEEFRVASFAQSLGTVEKVSEKRLDKRWQQLLGIAT